MKTLAEKVAEAAQFVNFKEENQKSEFIWDCLNQLGINDDDLSYELLMSNDSKEGDFRAVFCDKMKLALPRFRRIWRILKAGSKEELKRESIGELTNEFINKIMPIEQYSDKQLLEHYGVICDSKIEVELKIRSNQRYCIIFEDAENINIELSLKLLRLARRKEVSTIYKDGNKRTYRVYRVGQFPEQKYTRCPVTGRILINNYSNELGITWDIPMEAMQFIAVMVNEGIDINSITANDLQQKYKEKGMDGLINLFPKIAIIYYSLKKIAELPNLQTKMSSRDAIMDATGKTIY